MLIPFAVGTIAVILAYLSQHRQNGFGLKLSFFVILIFLALRYEYGNDYIAYLDIFQEIAGYEAVDIFEMRHEPGWILLNSIFAPFGFFAMIMFTSLLTCIVFYRFIRNYVPARYQWLAVFLYVFDPYLILVPASMMRQNITVLLFLVAFELLYRRKIILYLILAGIGVTFHRSGYVLLPLAVLPFVNLKINKFVAVLFFMFFVSLFSLGHIIVPIMFQMTGGLFGQYVETYAHAAGARQAALHSGIGFFFSLFLLSVILYFAGVEFNPDTDIHEESEYEGFGEFPGEQDYGLLPADPHAAYTNTAARRLLFKLALLSFLLTPMAFQLAIIGRINYFFTPVFIAIYPIILFQTRSQFFRLMLMGSLIPFTLLRFWIFFLSPVWQYHFRTYQTIFSAPQWF